jgi:hypothetical protein
MKDNFYKSFLISLIGEMKYNFYKQQFLHSSTNKVDNHGDLFRLNFWKDAKETKFIYENDNLIPTYYEV